MKQFLLVVGGATVLALCVPLAVSACLCWFFQAVNRQLDHWMSCVAWRTGLTQRRPSRQRHEWSNRENEGSLL